MFQTCATGDGFCCICQLAAAQFIEQIAGDDKPLSLTACQSFGCQMPGSGRNGIAHLGPESACGLDGLACDELAVDPGRTGRFDLFGQG